MNNPDLFSKLTPEHLTDNCEWSRDLIFRPKIDHVPGPLVSRFWDFTDAQRAVTRTIDQLGPNPFQEKISSE
jgi:hypothetical protein